VSHDQKVYPLKGSPNTKSFSM